MMTAPFKCFIRKVFFLLLSAATAGRKSFEKIKYPPSPSLG